MSEFRVEQRTLDASASANHEIAKRIFALQSQLESVLSGMNGQSGYDRIKQSLRGAIGESEGHARKTNGLAEALEEIVQLYTHTEENLTDSQIGVTIQRAEDATGQSATSSQGATSTQGTTSGRSTTTNKNKGSDGSIWKRRPQNRGGGGRSGGGGSSRKF